jgi:hypothetical protein
MPGQSHSNAPRRQIGERDRDQLPGIQVAGSLVTWVAVIPP